MDKIFYSEAYDRTVERFNKNIEKTSSCWLWKGSIDKYGYGYLYDSVRKKAIKAHRLSILIRDGCLSKNSLVLHKCNVKNCVNPDHLYCGDNFDNMRDRLVDGKYYQNHNGKTILNRNQVLYIVEEINKGRSKVSLSEELNVKLSVISKIMLGTTWQWLTNINSTKRHKSKLSKEVIEKIRYLIDKYEEESIFYLKRDMDYHISCLFNTSPITITRIRNARTYLKG